MILNEVRSVATDGAGQYQIVNLRPGRYTVTFSLAGFVTVKREGVELTGSFTATIDAALKVGTVAETVTVTGQSPIVDVQASSQQRVISKEIIDAIPALLAQPSRGTCIVDKQGPHCKAFGNQKSSPSTISNAAARARRSSARDR